MKHLHKVYILLCGNSVSFCNELSGSNKNKSDPMPLSLLAKVADRVQECSERCIIVTNSDALPPSYQELCAKMKAELIVPADYRGNIYNSNATVVFDSNDFAISEEWVHTSKAVLRTHRGDLQRFSEIMLASLEHFDDVSVRHPELLTYSQDDIENYGSQLQEVATWLLDKKDNWQSYRIDCLTNCFTAQETGECGGGISHLTIGHKGHVYICPGFIGKQSDSVGHILGDIEINNQHLLSREYSLPCKQACAIRHCIRCIYLNKLATREFCVPASNLCKLSYQELKVQAWFAKKALETGLLHDEHTIPCTPVVDDPYEIVKDEYRSGGDSWRDLVTIRGFRDLTPSAMLSILNEIDGRVKALLDCIKHGFVPPASLMQQDTLEKIRHETIGRYRDVVFQNECPTLYEIELLMHRIAEKTVAPSHLAVDPNQPTSNTAEPSL
ncbi:MAG: hypothetical protein ACYTBJ_05095 [Planctomycetota bacterium]|jgi:CXXX repeat peptide maturase